VSGLPITLRPFTLARHLPASASLLWDWSYAGDGIAASGTFTTSVSPDPAGYYQISGIAGSRNGDAITGLEPAGSAVPGNEGFPVDNLINASGQLTANGFGYETGNGNYANPFYADFLTPPAYQEVFTQPASSGFLEAPIQFSASVVPGITIATVAPGPVADTLSLVVVQAPRNGALSLHGTSLQYIPVSNSALAPEAFSFELMDQRGDVTPVITAVAGGNNMTAGNGNSTIFVRGGGDTIAVGNGTASIIPAGSGTGIEPGGTGDTISITANTSLVIFEDTEMVFAGDGNSTVNDSPTAPDLKIRPGSGHDMLLHFASDLGGVADLIGSIGGRMTAAAALSALKADGHGATLLPFGPGSALDFTGVASSQPHTSNFQIG
jgi:hypothetical protein